jgi:GNAT superfamily N-acetyltransferase
MIEVRHDLPADAEAVAQVSASATATLRQTYRPNARALANKARISRELKRLVAVLDGRVIGTTQYFTEPGCLRILGLGVLSDSRQRGAARALVEALQEIARRQGLRGLAAHTIRETGNVPVFERLGFHIVSEEPDDYSESDVFPELSDVELWMDLTGAGSP